MHGVMLVKNGNFAKFWPDGITSRLLLCLIFKAFLHSSNDGFNLLDEWYWAYYLHGLLSHLYELMHLLIDIDEHLINQPIRINMLIIKVQSLSVITQSEHAMFTQCWISRHPGIQTQSRDAYICPFKIWGHIANHYLV